MKGLLTYDVYPDEGLCVGVFDYKDGSGKFIKVDELYEWIDWHLRNRAAETVYSDLDKAIHGGDE